jgi:hypothetical protein
MVRNGRLMTPKSVGRSGGKNGARLVADSRFTDERGGAGVRRRRWW